jgi:hypothetical protein
VYAVNYNVLRVMSGMGGLEHVLIAMLMFIVLVSNQGRKVSSCNHLSSDYSKRVASSVSCF